MTLLAVKRRYTAIRRTHDRRSREVFTLYLVIDQQSFAMERSHTRKRANWYRRQLAFALHRMLHSTL